MVYNMSGVESSTNVLQLFSAVNTLSGNILVYMTLLALWVSLFMILLRNNTPRDSMFSSTMATTIVCLLFFAAGVTQVMIVLVGLTLLAGVLAVSMYLDK